VPLKTEAIEHNFVKKESKISSRNFCLLLQLQNDDDEEEEEEIGKT